MNRLVDSTLFKHSQNIACYFAVENEFDCAPIVKAIWGAKKNCYLPILSETNTLEFALYDSHTDLKFNRYRILEPDTSLYFPSDQLDLVLMPLVGFDLQGHRLGMGGGYYDRTFQFLHDKTIRKPFLLGLAFEFQKMEQIPVDPWDISMDGVLTEKQLYLF
jgi:5-formyltetrahydrofolate cyclo-ligase